MRCSRCSWLSGAAVIVLSLALGRFCAGLQAAELATLTPDTWDEMAPQGKESDCIYGDYVLRNEQLVAVVAKPVAGRNANMTVRNVGGAIIDLTRRDVQSDQLSAFYPASGFAFTSPKKVVVSADGRQLTGGRDVNLSGKTVWLECAAEAAPDAPEVTVRYTLADGQPYVMVETTYTNPHDEPVRVLLSDAVRADRTFQFGADAPTNLFWAYDEWFRQAYGVVVQEHEMRRVHNRAVVLQYARDGATSIRLQPGGSHTAARKLFPGADLLEVRAIANQIAGLPGQPVSILVEDPAGAVENAQVSIANVSNEEEERAYAWGRTPQSGRLSFELPDGRYRVTVTALGRPVETQMLDTSKALDYQIRMESCGYVAAEISGEDGGPIPCKVAFYGKGDVPDPFFGPDSGERAIHNLYYSHNGRFLQEIGPGQYDVIISYGNEYDAVFTEIEVRRGEPTRLEATLVRTVQTHGWISSDFHSHSTPSGDTTASQFGRVLNLLCEHIEFAPCTEHNRIDTYTPHLERIGSSHLMATATGIELTGSPLPVNHQNAFPLVHKPRTQDGGAPQTDINPIVQIERLAMWDDGSEKLVQGNHPNIVQILADRNLDGEYDGGFEAMFGFMDVIEVHPPHLIFTPPETAAEGRRGNNRIFNWMQLLNLGYRIPGVVNTDAHYNFHGSGWLRNYLKSSTDDPAQIKTMDMVRAAERGHIIMTNGPYLEVRARASQAENDAVDSHVIPGDELAAPGGRVELYVRVQCANWLDVNRVQVFVNGRPAEEFHFTRRNSPERFGDGVVKFEAEIPLELQEDAHLIVAAAGDGLQLGPVMGPVAGKHMPIAVSNPIFVDVDGGGFTPNGDMLGAPLPRDKHSGDEQAAERIGR